MHKIVYGAKLTPENLDDIIADGARVNLNLEDFRDDMEYYAEDGYDTYIIVTVVRSAGSTQAITFVTVPSIDFHNTWYFCNGSTHGPHLKQIKLANLPKTHV